MRMRRPERQNGDRHDQEPSWSSRIRWFLTVLQRRRGWILGPGLLGGAVLLGVIAFGWGSYREAESRVLLLGPSQGGEAEWLALRSAAGLVASPRLIERALERPEATAWRLRRRGQAGVSLAMSRVRPICEPVGRSLRIQVRGETHAEAAGLADALAGVLLEEEEFWRADSGRRAAMEGERDRLQRERDRLREQVRARAGHAPEEILEAQAIASVMEYRVCLERLAKLRLARIEQQYREDARGGSGWGPGKERAMPSGDRLELVRLREELAEAQRRSRKGSDAAAIQARMQALAARGAGEAVEPVEAHADLAGGEKLSLEIAELEARMEELERASRGVGGESVERAFLREDLAAVEAQLGRIQQRLLEDVGGASGRGPLFQIVQRARATAGRERWPGLMAGLVSALSWITLCVAAGCGVERRLGRVSAASEVVERLHLDVLSVIPPPPPPAFASSERGDEGTERFEHFVRSVDHLRELVCASWPDGPRRHVLLITSAVGSEGKTSLAAQLASRCAGAGLSIALVDADLRRPALGRLFDLDDDRAGLMDVLCGTAEASEALHAVVRAGGFYVMPAGTEGMDPTRLLHSERLGQVIDQLRDAFDLVIVDAPPVLPVADALTLGRWVDGAIVAVRRDASRLAWVKDALARLEAVHVPVLGAVVQGCEVEGHSYGPYRAVAVLSGRLAAC
jgi:capsular exopolysaccharide synthesis family protein